MSKKQRREQRYSDVLIVPKRPKPVLRIPSRLRDPLFGDMLITGTPRILHRDYDPSRPGGTRYGIPDRLMLTRQVPTRYTGEDVVESDTSNSLGHAEWSPAFQRYMAGIKTREQLAEQHEWVCWWQNTYIVDRLIAYAQDPNALFTLDELDAVLAYKRGAVALIADKSPFWLSRKTRCITHYVRDHYLPYTHPRKRRMDA